MMRGKRFILSTWIIFFVSFSIYGFDQTNKVQKTLKHEVKVTLKLIQVYVTDKKGNPVTDLEKSDFVLYDSGKLKTITEFEKHLLTLPGEKAEIAKPIKPVKTPDKPPRMTRKFLLFFDFTFNAAPGILKAKRAALHFIDTQLHSDDEVSIISYNSFKGLTLHEYFTTEHDRVRDIVKSFGLMDAGGRAQNIINDNFINKFELDQMGERKEIIDRLKLDNYRSQVLNFSQELKDLAKVLRYIPGKKHIILFSSGVANFILYPSSSRVPLKEFGKSSNIRNDYEEMCDELAASNSQVFPINTAGKIVSHFRDRDDMGDYSLRQLAKLSDGIYYDNISSYKEITEQIHNITSSYYVLGYQIEDKWDGKFQKIKIKVKRKGCKVFGQSGYFNPKLFSEYSKLEKLFHLIDLALSESPLQQDPQSQISERFRMTAQVCSFDTKNNLLLAAHLPVEAAVQISEGKVEVISLIFDERNEIISQLRWEEDWSNLARKDVYLLSGAGVPPGIYRCRIVIRDMETGTARIAGCAIDVRSAGEDGFQIFPPLLLRKKKGAFYVREMESEVQSRVSQSFEFADSHLIETSGYVPFLGSTMAPDSDVWASIRCAVPTVMDTGISLSAILVDKTKLEEINVPLEIVREREEMGVKTFFVRLWIPDVVTDEYTLIFTAEHIASDNKTETVRDYFIK